MCCAIIIQCRQALQLTVFSCAACVAAVAGHVVTNFHVIKVRTDCCFAGTLKEQTFVSCYTAHP